MCRPIIICGFFLFCVGCGFGASYQPGSWMHQQRDADWDVDSAICLQRSETFTEEDREAITRIKERARDKKQSAQAAAETTQSAGSSMGESERLALDILSGAMSFGGALDEQTAEEKVRENKFSDCMQDKGWTQP